MFQKLISLWRSPRRMTELHQQAMALLELQQESFEQMLESLKGRLTPADAAADVTTRQGESQRLGRAIHGGIEQHLILCPGMNVHASLSLWSLVDQSERLSSDFQRLLRLMELLGQPPGELRHHHEIAALGHHVAWSLGAGIRAFDEDDERLARDVLEDETLTGRRCDALIRTVGNAGLPPAEAVCAVQWIRFMRRIDAFAQTLCRIVLPPELPEDDPRTEVAQVGALAGSSAAPQDA